MEETIKDFLKFIKEKYEKTNEFENKCNEKINEINKKYNLLIDLNLISARNQSNWTSKQNLNMLFKNNIYELHYSKKARTAGYYLMISDLFNKKAKMYISQGLNFFDGAPTRNGIKYDKNNFELKRMLDSFLYTQLNIGEKQYKTIDFVQGKEQYEFEIENVDEKELEDVIQYLNEKVKDYPVIMKEFLSEHKEEADQMIGFEKKQKTQQRLFSTFNRTYLLTQKIKPIGFESSYITNENTRVELNKPLAENAKAHKGESVIYYGIPGSGKSYYIKNKILNGVPEENFERVTFYPEYTYYDFVGQKLPKDDGTGLQFEPGPFTRILEKALKNRQKHYYLIIEEMNRGNAQAIFGDIFQLLDRDTDGNSVYATTNYSVSQYLKNKGINLKESKIIIPSNVTIISTINTSDQNVFNLDTAFGRRWQYEVFGEEQTKGTNNIYSKGNIIGIEGFTWNEIREKINEKILKSEEIFNAEDKRMGLYYIDKECLSKGEETEELKVMSRKKFANKIFRYLWTDVFKNDREAIFYTEKYNTLEKIIIDFTNGKAIEQIIKIRMENIDE